MQRNVTSVTTVLLTEDFCWAELTKGHFGSIWLIGSKKFYSFTFHLICHWQSEIRMNDLPVTSPFPYLNWWKQIHPSTQPARSGDSHQHTHTHAIHLFFLAYMQRQTKTHTKLHMCKHTKRHTSTQNLTHRNVAVRRHNAGWWLAGQDKCCQLYCQSPTQHRAVDRI